MERFQYLIHMSIRLPPTSQISKSIIAKKSFAQQFELFVKRYGLEWRDD